MNLKKNKSLTITLILLVLCCFFGFNKQTQPEIIIWNKNRLLNWNDFKAQPENNCIDAAMTSSGVTMNWKTKRDSAFVTVVAFMNPQDSWVISNERTNALLKHEQLHFDISELHARKLRQNILLQKLNKKDLANVLKSLVGNSHKLRKQSQNQYDLEIRQNKSKQLEWEKKVALELKSLEQYSNTEIRVLLK